MAALSRITFRLPATPEARDFLGELRTLCIDVAYADGTAADRLTLSPPRPAGARPVTTFRLADVAAPEVVFDTGPSIGVRTADVLEPRILPTMVEMAELVRRLRGHVRRVDHTGVNLPAGTISADEWRHLVSGLASVSAMYRYPTGEDWPFILPATPAERADDIREFVTGREPRFELVHDQWGTQTQWQIALWTDLTRAEAERLFPDPEGITPVGLEDIFRVVPVRHPWAGLGIRFDLCFRAKDDAEEDDAEDDDAKDDAEEDDAEDDDAEDDDAAKDAGDAGDADGGDSGVRPADWETGRWLVTEGGRIRP